MNVTRRGFLAGLGAILAAPAIIKVAMPISVPKAVPLGEGVYCYDLVDLLNRDVEIQLRRGAEMAFRRYEREHRVILAAAPAPEMSYRTDRAQHTALFSARVIGYAA
jgi:hypothetical protein